MLVVVTDVNECLTISDACVNGQCINSQGSYRCKCMEGMVLGSDGKTCMGEYLLPYVIIM